jgi:hypothetical protein
MFSIAKTSGKKNEEAGGGKKRGNLSAVHQRQTAVVAAQLAFEAIVEDPLLAILKFDTDKTQAAWNL